MEKIIRIGRRRYQILGMAAAVFLLFPALLHGASAAHAPPLLVLDPGHGGHDSGVKGLGGSLEKNVALAFARVLKKALAQDYQVKLTRTGDYQLSLRKRASMANHHEAALFISIHCGGFFKNGPEAWMLYFSPAKGRYPGNRFETSEKDKMRWKEARLKAARESHHLADTLSRHLRACSGVTTLQTVEAPVFLLEGLDMPALIIETGYLTNPACESRMNDPDFLAEAAECIRQGIDAFLKKP